MDQDLTDMSPTELCQLHPVLSLALFSWLVGLSSHCAVVVLDPFGVAVAKHKDKFTSEIILVHRVSRKTALTFEFHTHDLMSYHDLANHDMRFRLVLPFVCATKASASFFTSDAYFSSVLLRWSKVIFLNLPIQHPMMWC